MKRNIRQIAVASAPDAGSAEFLFALAEDGTLWMMKEPSAYAWEWRQLPGLPDRESSTESAR